MWRAFDLLNTEGLKMSRRMEVTLHLEAELDGQRNGVRGFLKNRWKVFEIGFIGLGYHTVKIGARICGLAWRSCLWGF